jgi:hypothetical protein
LNKKILTVLIALAGFVLLGLAIYYWATPAGSLPHSFPGYELGSTHVHIKHGIAAFILAAGCGILAWFVSAPEKSGK